MSDDCNRTPFWQRQPRLPLAIHRFLQDRMEAALQDPEARQALVWPTILGAPGLRRAHPAGLPESELLGHATRMLGALGHHDPAAAWRAHRTAWPDTAEGDAAGWRPGSAWGAWGPLVSLRCGWQLAALTPLPLGERYPLACGVSLFNHGLYHECHDALEPLWAQAEGELKQGLQASSSWRAATTTNSSTTWPACSLSGRRPWSVWNLAVGAWPRPGVRCAWSPPWT